ncbi:hypothetical protein BOO86_11675 [Mycobacterium sp. CBMA 234]|uniref:hypothetical protein n=1 Tax=Mycolicibacterium sp. CBMA 234 TaxID=1918495 RepID=UPI0012DE6F7C|nr:hypothetical protein [Mycolicibacterium sp. CBMA 234]MUL65126.1 hypothetical protein [Mycolicibacterium sp. CBMA 234]
MNTTTHAQQGRKLGRVLAATAVGLSALSIMFVAPAAAKGPHPGPVIDRPEPTSSLSAQNNTGRSATPPVRLTQHPVPNAITRSQPTSSVGAQRNNGAAASPASASDPGTTSFVASHTVLGGHDKCTRAKNGGMPPWCTDPAAGFSSAAHRAEGSFPTLPGAEAAAEAGRALAGLPSAS